MHGVGVLGPGPYGVVGPAELLNRADVACHRIAGIVFEPGEVQETFQPAVRPIAAGALDGEAEKAFALCFIDVKAEQDPGRAPIGPQRDAVVLARGAH